ncbi:hypothetical protein F3Y22_tig00111745pilonHSYRG00137 [Hibiscus syriacus]|uniref:Reverse transcriptase zinc-binding domain-containing protein n=1 Tax=Hibiscus syriacus TaxID=106335 RepID=A0A6A2XFP2_HIBSY|nr:hypothetical protein F3Y22_tig00111745pilonHSYRG00137 [Hibiscus syriacus]
MTIEADTMVIGNHNDAILPKAVSYRTSSWMWRSLVNPAGNFLSVFLTDLSLAVNKTGKIKDFGCRVLDSWEWRIELRRPFFEWEKPIWNEFIQVSCDRLVEDHVWRFVWIKLVPPKVSVFVWKAVYQRLSVMVELLKRGVNCSDQVCCLHCKLAPEENESKTALVSGILRFDLDSMDLQKSYQI